MEYSFFGSLRIARRRLVKNDITSRMVSSSHNIEVHERNTMVVDRRNRRSRMASHVLRPQRGIETIATCFFLEFFRVVVNIGCFVPCGRFTVRFIWLDCDFFFVEKALSAGNCLESAVSTFESRKAVILVFFVSVFNHVT